MTVPELLPPPKTPGNVWSVFEQTEQNVAKLRALCHPQDLLKQRGYRVDLYSEEDLEIHKVCSVCNEPFKRKPRKKKVVKSVAYLPHTAGASIDIATDRWANDAVDTEYDTWNTPYEQAQHILEHFTLPNLDHEELKDLEGRLKGLRTIHGLCFSHDGLAVGKGKDATWTCCQKKKDTIGCQLAEQHILAGHDLQKLRERWWLYETPRVTVEDIGTRNVRVAVAIDCEMGLAQDGEAELISISMVDYFTGKTLLSSLVFPGIRITSCQTQYNGITFRDLWIAKSVGEAVMGNKAVRERIWKFVGPETVVIMHNGRSDLHPIHWIHRCIVDTQIVEQARRKPKKSCGLAFLLDTRVGKTVQIGTHDSLEDALATRELGWWYANNPEGLEKAIIGWGDGDAAPGVSEWNMISVDASSWDAAPTPVANGRKVVEGTLDDIGFKSFQEKMWNCEICAIEVNAVSKGVHLKTPRHKVCAKEAKQKEKEAKEAKYGPKRTFTCGICNIIITEEHLVSESHCIQLLGPQTMTRTGTGSMACYEQCREPGDDEGHHPPYWTCPCCFTIISHELIREHLASNIHQGLERGTVAAQNRTATLRCALCYERLPTSVHVRV